MRILLVHAHPRPDSFNAALKDAVLKGLGNRHEVELRDLYAEGFNPALSAEERGRYHDIPANLEGIEDHVESLRRAEALILVYPTWWYGLPAMLKGWFDRVWSPGVAFTLTDGAIAPALTNIRRIIVVTTYGSPRWLLWYMGHPDEKLIRRGIRRLCAKNCTVEWHALTRMDHRTRPELEAHRAKIEATFARL
jgi:putative NADPH-quinone reductase